MPDCTSHVPRLCRSALKGLIALVALASCRDLDTPEPMRNPGAALATASGIPQSLPFHMNGIFRAAPGAQRMDCGPGLSVPERLIAEGVFAPHMGATNSVLALSSCEASGGTTWISVRDTLSGATGDSLYGYWIITVGEIRGGKAALTLDLLYLRGSGWYGNVIGQGTGTGTIDVASGSGSYSAAGTIGPRQVGPPPTEALNPETITTGADDFACGLTAAGTAYCWGNNANGELGDGTTTTRSTPTPVAGGLAFTRIDAGLRHVCGLTAAGETYCWGQNAHGELGTGDVNDRATPTLVVGGHVFTQVDAGFEHTCAVTATGTAYCWGYNVWGSLGDGTTTERHKPSTVSGRLDFAMISAGEGHTCGLTTTGDAYCWGHNIAGEVGDSTTIDRDVPTAVVGGHKFARISSSFSHSCALLADTFVAYCWGSNTNRQLANSDLVWGGFQVYPRPVVGDYHFNSISTGFQHTCGITTTEVAVCWGDNIAGELGIGTNIGPELPGPVSSSATFTQIQASQYFTCGVAATGVAYCWGSGQLVPTPIASPLFKP